jgi:hypothetical protein
MKTAAPATVRMIAFLDSYRKERGLPTTVLAPVPEDGVRARELAEALNLPLEMVEGAFLNQLPVGLDAVVRPGDRIAFVPFGTPASHPAFFGAFVTRG